jgi:hypothetical protein
MKHPNMKCTRWQLPRQSRLIARAAPVDCNRYSGIARDLCFKNGVPVWDGPKEVGRGWGDFLRVFAQP